MPYTDLKEKELSIKIIYYGPPLVGKLTNLTYLHTRAITNSVTSKPGKKITSVYGKGYDTIYCFSFIPDLNKQIEDLKIRVHLYCLHGPIVYPISRTILLKGINGIVFVADSYNKRFGANSYWLSLLREDTNSCGVDLLQVPYVLQLNNRDYPSETLFSVEQLNKDLRFKGEPYFEAIANQGIGVLETFNEIFTQVYNNLKDVDISQYPTKEEVFKKPQ